MKRDLIASIQDEKQLRDLRSAYSIIQRTYEDILGGPRMCIGTPEFHAAKQAIEVITAMLYILGYEQPE